MKKKRGNTIFLHNLVATINIIVKNIIIIIIIAQIFSINDLKYW